MIQKDRIYETMKRLVAVPTVSGTREEAQGARALQELLYEIPYFAEHKETVKLVPLRNDPLHRSIVTAFLDLHPNNPNTVILSGHYDVVDVEEFGPLQDIAYDVEAVTKRIGEMPIDEDTRKDWASGEWLFGRGTADMKYGHALCLELLRYYSENPDAIDGKLLYVAVCGEETNSEGMLRAVDFFNDFAEENHLHYVAFLLTECYMMEDQAGDTNRYIHYGSSGKVMPMFFFVGESSHAGEPFLGIDPTMMSVEVYRRLQLNTDFCQESHGATTPPPACLKLQDLKTTYSVSMPLYAVAYYTYITVALDPAAMMAKLRMIAEEAMQEAIRTYEKRVEGYVAVTGEKTPARTYAPCVMTYRELLEAIQKDYAGDLTKDLAAYADKLRESKPEIQDVAVALVKHTVELYKNKGPMIVYGLIPPYYPDSYLPKEDPDTAGLMEACDRVIAYADQTYGEKLRMKDWYMGISDMCYTGLAEGRRFDALFENLIGIGSIYPFPEASLRKFKVPGIVLGGYGKDFHKNTERLHKHYNFDVLPDLYVRLIDDLLKKKQK